MTSPSPAKERDAKVSEAVVEPALWGVVPCAADSSVLACCYSQEICVWPTLGSGGGNVCDVLSCLWWISNCPPSGEKDPAALLVSSAVEPRGREEMLTVSGGPGS